MPAFLDSEEILSGFVELRRSHVPGPSGCVHEVTFRSGFPVSFKGRLILYHKQEILKSLEPPRSNIPGTHGDRSFTMVGPTQGSFLLVAVHLCSGSHLIFLPSHGVTPSRQLSQLHSTPELVEQGGPSFSCPRSCCFLC